MPISMRCPGCDTKFEFAGDLEGKRIQCKTCGDVFRIERPTREPRDDAVDAVPKRKARPFLIIGPLVGLAVVVAIVVVVLASRP